MTEAWLHISGYSDSDAEEQAALAWRLEQELRELDVDDIARPRVEPPAGAKGGALAWAQLTITFVGVLPALMTAVQSWLQRHPRASITLEIEGDRLTLDDATASERSELIAAWMRRHGG